MILSLTGATIHNIRYSLLLSHLFFSLSSVAEDDMYYMGKFKCKNALFSLSYLLFRSQARENLYEEFSNSFGQWSTGPLPTFAVIKERCDSRPTWAAVETEQEREEIYADWLADYARRILEAREKDSMKRRDALVLLLRSSPRITPETTWASLPAAISEEKAFQQASELERIQAWEVHLKDVEECLKQERRIQEEDRRRSERRARGAFKALLMEQMAAGSITAKSRWRVSLVPPLSRSFPPCLLLIFILLLG